MICASASADDHIAPAGSGVLEVSKPPERAERRPEAHASEGRSSHRVLRSVWIAGPAGKLEGLLNEGASDAAFAALVCHPYPPAGGTMHNRVVYHAMQVMNRRHWGFEFPVLRFNYRGVGLSGGVHDGKAESEDVRAALDWLDGEFGRPIVLAGFSFGSAMALKACCGSHGTDRRVRAVAALGLPVEVGGRVHRYSLLEEAHLPKLFLSGARDEFARPEQLEEIAARAAEPKRLILISGADHFFTHQLSAMQQAMAGWLKEHLA
ncbi:MAG TPA: alpha/beta family hydrolase [Terracidiphilus sp.]|nr:alpha/beta family hydrolase [Terracidiphilus sp.]